MIRYKYDLMKRINISILMLSLLIAVGCSKEEKPAEPDVSTLTTGTWRITEAQYSYDFPVYFTITGNETTGPIGTVNFLMDSMYFDVNTAGMLMLEEGNPQFIPITDSRYGTFTILNEDEFSMVDQSSQEIITIDGLGRTENSWHMRYAIPDEVPIGIDSVLQVKEVFILKLER